MFELVWVFRGITSKDVNFSLLIDTAMNTFCYGLTGIQIYLSNVSRGTSHPGGKLFK